nr:hypothetical protein [Tanacetum cinerariifolium]
MMAFLLFLDVCFQTKQKNLENKASLVKAAQGKDAKGKAAKGKAVKGKDAKCKAAQGKAAQPSDIGLNIGIVPQQLSLVDSNPITQIRPDLKERDENLCRKTYDYVACKERSEQVDNQNGFTRDDEPEDEQDGSGTSDKATSVCDDIDEAKVAADDNAKATSVHDDVGVPDAAADDNEK